MPFSTRCLLVAFLTCAIALSACVGPLASFPAPPIARECHYDEANEAAQVARQQYQAARASRAPRASVEQLRQASEVADEAFQQAGRCEERARSSAELFAQQQSAQASIEAVQLAYWALILTALEIIALVGTICVGIWAVWETRDASKREVNAIREEGASEAERFERELSHLKSINAHQMRAYIAIDDISTPIAKNSTVEHVLGDWLSAQARIKNVGATPATDIDLRINMMVSDRLPDFPKFDPPANCGILFPGMQVFTARRFIPYSEVKRAFYSAGQLRIYVEISVRYRDVFSTDWRETTQCMVFELHVTPEVWLEHGDKMAHSPAIMTSEGGYTRYT